MTDEKDLGDSKVRDEYLDDDVVARLNELFKDDIWVPDWIIGDEEKSQQLFLPFDWKFIYSKSKSNWIRAV